MWELTGPGLEPAFPALAGGFLTTAPPGKPQSPLLEEQVQVGIAVPGHAQRGGAGGPGHPLSSRTSPRPHS